MSDIVSNRSPDFSILRAALIGLSAFGLLFAGQMPAIGNMPLGASQTAFLAVIMAVLWASEALPVHVTAFLPIVALPYFGIETLSGVLGAALQPGLLVFLGSFVAATAIDHQGLHKHLARQLITSFGGAISSVLLGLMLITALFSMVMSNTTAALIMMPIGLSLAGGFMVKRGEGNKVKGTFALGIAYAATIGGMVTLIGTPPNILTSAFLRETYSLDIGFAAWMAVSLPLAGVMFVCAWKLLSFSLGAETKGVKLQDSATDLSSPEGTRFTKAQIRVLILVGLLLLGWMTRPLMNIIIPVSYWNDVTISLFVAVLLWVLPGGRPKGTTGAEFHIERLAPIRLLKNFPLPVIFLFGGGLMLAHGFTVSGLADWLANSSQVLVVLPKLMLFFIFVLAVSIITEFMSNTATAAVLLPVAAAVAEGTGLSPIALVLAVCFASNAAFIMPIATAPNTIAFMTGHLHSKDMMRRGVVLNLMSAIIITIGIYLLELRP